jgi:2-polyprenyl-3-methyl-5-hydroxy-6-metoxy-1,4-benzoquinol methylase
MGRCTDGPGPGAFDEGQAQAYAAAIEIETEFLHDQVFLELLRRHARGTALDLGGGNGRYAAWLLRMGRVTSVHVIDTSPLMIEECVRRGLPGLRAHVGDIETADLGREQYHIVLARFVLMHVRDLEGTLQRMAMSLQDQGTLVVVTNILEGTPTALAAVIEQTSGIMRLILQVKGTPIVVSNYARTQEEYTHACRQAGLSLGFCETYAPQILHFAQEPPGVTLSHLVLMGKKSANP